MYARGKFYLSSENVSINLKKKRKKKFLTLIEKSETMDAQEKIIRENYKVVLKKMKF